MVTNGYKLKELLKLKKIELRTQQAILKGSFYKFEDEDKKTPLQAMSDIMVLEEDIAKIQTAQKYYNLNSEVEVEGFPKMSLELAIKLLGGYSRKSKVFRDYAAGDPKKRRYSMEEPGPQTRREGAEHQKAVITKEDALQQSIIAETKVSNLKTAIALANANDMKINFLNIS
jgi:hypothetical protein